MKYRLIEDGNGWFIIECWLQYDRKWREHKNYFECLEEAENEMYQIKDKLKKDKLRKVVKRILDEFE
uniref:Uncharacterized protein n=1 Tax=viral metagenome TaxID=1070528 RepID=A0A6M3K9I6_9ZZZZ